MSDSAPLGFSIANCKPQIAWEELTAPLLIMLSTRLGPLFFGGWLKCRDKTICQQTDFIALRRRDLYKIKRSQY